MNLKNTASITTIALCLVYNDGFAQQINNPNHIPNGLKNKVNRIRVQSLVEEENLLKDTEQQIPSETEIVDPELIPNIDLLGDGGCSISIGNSVVDSRGIAEDRTVVVVGDIVNVCE